MQDDDLPEKYDAGNPFDPEFFPRRNLVPLRTRILFWTLVAGSIALGTFLFFFFMTVFLYFFVPLFLIFTLLSLISRVRRR